MLRTGLVLLVAALMLMCGAAPVFAHEVIYDFAMDTDPGWTASAGSTWSYGNGTAAYGAMGVTITGGHTGSNWYAFRRDATAGGTPYPVLAEEQTLTTAALDCSGLHNLRLDFWRLVCVSVNDYMAVRASTDGVNWTTVWETGGYPTWDVSWVSLGWEQVEYDLSEIADDQPTVYLQWVMGPTVGSGGLGWNIDDVQIVADPTPDLVYSFPLTTDPGWSRQGAWAFGTPTGVGGDPTSAHTGSGAGNNVFGYNLAGDYTNLLMGDSLTTTALNCTEMNHTTLKFWRQLSVETSTYDHVSVEVSTDNATWTPVWQNQAGSMLEGEWQQCSYDISALADGQPTVYIRWVMGPTDSSVTYGGWNIDDIEIWGHFGGSRVTARPRQVLAWVPYTDQSQEYPLSLQSLRYTDTAYNWYRQVIAESYTLDPDELARELRGKDVFLVPEQETTVPAQLIAAGAAFADVLQDFVYNGGTVVVCGEVSDWGGFMDATGLMSVTQLGWETTGSTLTVADTDHYLATGLGATFLAPNATYRYSVGPESTPVVIDGAGNAIVAVRDYGYGAAVLVGFDYYATNTDATRVLGNAACYPKTTKHAYYWDTDATTYTIRDALTRLRVHYYNYSEGASADDWETDLHWEGADWPGGEWDLVVADAPATQATDGWAALIGQIEAGRKVLMQSASLTGLPDLQAAFDISSATGLDALPALSDWNDATALFHLPNEVSALAGWDNAWPTSGERLTPSAEGEALAGFTASPTAGQAAIVLGNDGRTLYDGFVWDEGNQDADYDGIDDTVELVMNQMAMLLRRPEADFTASWSGTIAPLTVHFTDLSSGVIGSWYWDFGDGSTSIEQDPVHSYTTTGPFTVSLRVTNEYNHSTMTKVALIAVTATPGANFSATPTTGGQPLAVSFSDLSTNVPTTWAWDFGDPTSGGANTSAAQNPSHTYATAGSYDVSLTVTNAAGSDTETKPDYITVASPIAAAFTVANATGTVPLTVSFTDTTTGGPDAWSWDFGDGGASTDHNPSHIYETPGYYDVTLTAHKGVAVDVETKEGCVAAGFVDAGPENWAFHYILACATADMVQGYFGNNYKPTQEVTRGQMAVYLARALAGGDELVPSGPDSPTFPDVAVDHWAYNYVEYVADLGVVQGYGGGSYKPDVVVNRGQMAVFIARAVADPVGDASVPEASASDPAFPDVTATNDWGWCYKYVQYLATLDPLVVQGYPNGTYRPELNVTRDQMAVYVQRGFQLPMYLP